MLESEKTRRESGTDPSTPVKLLINRYPPPKTSTAKIEPFPSAPPAEVVPYKLVPDWK